jgi:hypothetical protein
MKNGFEIKVGKNEGDLNDPNKSREELKRKV